MSGFIPYQPGPASATTGVTAAKLNTDFNRINPGVNVAPIDPVTLLVPIANTDVAGIEAALTTVYTGTVALAGPYTGRPIIQRDTKVGGAFGLGTGTVPLSITVSKSVSYIEYQVVDATTLAVQEAWQPYPGGIRPGAAQLIQVKVSARLGWNFLQVRVNGVSASITQSTVPFGVGINIAVLGQSLAVDMFSPYASGDTTTLVSLGISPSAFSSMCAAYAQEAGADVNNPPTWATPADGTVYNSSSGVTLLNKLITETGVNCGLVGYAVGSSPISEWLPGSAGANPHVATFLTICANNVNAIDCVIWRQGHRDVQLGTPQQTYAMLLTTVINTVALAFPQHPFRRVYMTIPSLGTYSGASMAAVLAIRNGAKGVANLDQAGEYVDSYNAPLFTDLVHPSQAGGITDASDIYRAVARLLGYYPIGAAGPYISGPLQRLNANPRNILIPIQQMGGTSITGTGTVALRFGVYLSTDTSFSSPLGISTVALTANLITITLASDPGATSILNVIPYPYPDSTSSIAAGVFDNYLNSGDSIGFGRMLEDSAVVYQIPALGAQLTVAAPGSAPTANTSFTLTGTYFGEVPSTFDYSTDGGVTWAAMGTASVSGGTWSAAVTAGLPIGVWAITIRNHLDTGVQATTAAFQVNPASVVALPTIANHVLSIQPDTGLTNLYVDTALSAQAVINSAVGGVKDQTGTGNNFLSVPGQTPPLVAPTFVQAIKNGYPALQFITANLNTLRIVGGAPLPPQLQASAGWTMAFFFNAPALPTTGLFYEMFEVITGTLQARIRFVMLATGNIRCYLEDDSGTITQLNSPTAITAGNTCGIVCGWDGTNFKMTVDAQTEQTAAPGTHTEAVAWSDAWIGAQRTGTNTWSSFAGINLLGFHAWNQAYLTSNATSLMTYKTTKWGT